MGLLTARDLDPNGFRGRPLTGCKAERAEYFACEQLDFIEMLEREGVIQEGDLFTCQDYWGNELVYEIHELHLNKGEHARYIYPEFKAMVRYTIWVTRTNEFTERSIPVSDFLWKSPCKQSGKPAIHFRKLDMRKAA